MIVHHLSLFLTLKQIFFFLLLSFFFNQHQLLAQPIPIDSLERDFNAATTDKERVTLLLNGSLDDCLAYPDQALIFHQKGLKMAQQMGDNKKIAQLTLRIADIYWKGKLYESEGFDWYQKALEAAEKAQYYEGCAAACMNIGFIYNHQGFRDKMFQYLLKSIDFTEKTAFPDVEYYKSLIYYYTEDNRISEAYALGEKVVQLEKKGYFEAIDKLLFYGYFLQVLKKMPDKAQEIEVYTSKIQRIIDSTDLGNNTADITNIAYVFLHNNRPDITIKLATQLLNIKKNYKTKEITAYAHQYLAEAYEMLGNYPLSIQHYKAYAEAQVDFVTTTLTNQTREKILTVETEKALLVKQNEIDKQRLFAISGFCMAVILLLGLIFVYYFYKRERKTKQELATLNATKDKLFSIIAHDLRSPIGTLKAYLEMTDFGLMSQADFANTSQQLTNNVNALFQTLDNLLQWAYSQLRGIKAQPENINLHEVAREELQFLHETTLQKNIAIINNIAAETTVFADKNQIGLVIRNTVSNALKFTNAGGEIVLNCKNTEGSKIEIQISDNGIGIPQDIQNQLFTINEKASRRGTAQEKGQGLGLILAKEMVEANKGSLKIESVENKGTTVYLTLNTMPPQ
jgi:signal transduction histidine kinase